MNNFEGLTRFLNSWAEFYREAIPAKLDEKYGSDDEKKLKAIMSPKEHFRAIMEAGTAIAFTSIAQACVNNKKTPGEFRSEELVRIDYQEMDESLFSLVKGEAAASEKRKVRQRLQTSHITTVKTLEYFDLLSIEVRNDEHNVPKNHYVITDKGRAVLSKLMEGE